MIYIGVLRNPKRTTCNAAEHVKFFVTELDNGDIGFADLTIQKLREVCNGLCRSVVSVILSKFVPFLTCKCYTCLEVTV